MKTPRLIAVEALMQVQGRGAWSNRALDNLLAKYKLDSRDSAFVSALFYGVLERQFHNYYEKAIKMQGVKGENLLQLLERRLDNVVFRMGFARTRAEARQMVSHKQFTVNGRRVNIPSYLVTAGDVVGVAQRAQNSIHFQDIFKDTSYRMLPPWLSADQEGLSGQVHALPTREQIDLPVDERLIIELYSR